MFDQFGKPTIFSFWPLWPTIALSQVQKVFFRMENYSMPVMLVMFFLVFALPKYIDAISDVENAWEGCDKFNLTILYNCIVALGLWPVSVRWTCLAVGLRSSLLSGACACGSSLQSSIRCVVSYLELDDETLVTGTPVIFVGQKWQ